MNRDSLLFLIIGLLTGFIGGYLAHEVLEARQPPPAWLVRAAQQAGTTGAVSRAPAGVSTPAPGASSASDVPAAGGPAAGVPTAGAQAPGSPNPSSQEPMAAMQAVQQLRAYVAENPDDADAVRSLANMNYDIRNWSRAVELYEQYLALDPDDVDVRTDLGASYRNLERPEEALEAFREALERSPAHWQARYNEVLVLAFDLERIEDAQASLELLVAQQPDNPEVARLAQAVGRR